nr:SusC/RagA family TonB-linked outer membrane protein [Segetibacter sp.]
AFLSPNNLTEAANESNYYTLQGLAEYTKKFNKHQVNLLLGYSFEENKSSNFNGFRDNLPGDDLTVLNVGSPSNMQSAGTGSEWAIESEFARANYSYANKYLIEGVVRRDASSRFAPSYKYAVFPSVAVGWRIGQEAFIQKNLPWVSELKLKASTGVLGNQNIGNYPYQNALVGIANGGGNAANNTNGFNGTNYSFGGAIAQGVARATFVDSTIHWESTRTTDVGLELGVNNKFNFSATYFTRLTDDILYSPSASVSNALGVNLSESNTGSLRNNGWEFTAGIKDNIGKVGYNINGNFSIINNKVLDLGVGNITQPNGMVGNGSTLFIGYPMNLYYGYVADGLFVDTGDIKSWPNITKVNPAPKPGDVRFKDISGPDGVPDGVVDATYDRTVLGSQIPKYTYGVNLGANYKGFDVSVLLQGVAGVQGNLAGSFGFAFNNNGNLQRWQYEERWTTDNPDRYAKYPRLEIITNSGTANSLSSSFWTLDGSYLRIKNLQFGYSLPKTVLQSIKISNARFYVSGENLRTFSNYRKGWDPEINTGGNFYPILSNFTFGLNLTF